MIVFFSHFLNFPPFFSFFLSHSYINQVIIKLIFIIKYTVFVRIKLVMVCPIWYSQGKVSFQSLSKLLR